MSSRIVGALERTELRMPRRATFVREGEEQPITDVLKGKTVDRILTTGVHLIIRFDDGIEARISVRDLGGRILPGRPHLDEVCPYQR